MLKMFYRALNNEKGFTLIELIVVIAILGILAAVAIPRLSGFTEKAKIKANIAGIQTLQSIVRVYEADNGSLPDDLDDLKDAGLLEATPEAPAIVTDDDGTGTCVKDDYFEMNATTGIVSIGQAGVILSDVAS